MTQPYFTSSPEKVIATDGLPIHSFAIPGTGNIDPITVKSFGEEWLKFNSFSMADINQIGADYFDILPIDLKLDNAAVMDMGCGTGRWALYLAPKVGFIDCVDPSEAVQAAAFLLKDFKNIRLTQADVDHLPFADSSYDLVYSLGVLHHIPDTFDAMQKCVRKVKPGGFFLVYLYYNLDNRKTGFKLLFRGVNTVRKGISKMPSTMKKFVCDLIAAGVYLPLSKFSLLLKKAGLKSASAKVPLSYYRDKSFWIMKNDALDRFGTPLEQRFSRAEIITMMEGCGLQNIKVSEHEPYWHAIGQKI